MLLSDVDAGADDHLFRDDGLLERGEGPRYAASLAALGEHKRFNLGGLFAVAESRESLVYELRLFGNQEPFAKTLSDGLPRSGLPPSAFPHASDRPLRN